MMALFEVLEYPYLRNALFIGKPASLLFRENDMGQTFSQFATKLKKHSRTPLLHVYNDKK